MDDYEQALRERAYFIWETEGRVDGFHLDHWQRAKNELPTTEQDAEDISSANMDADQQCGGVRDGATGTTGANPPVLSPD